MHSILASFRLCLCHTSAFQLENLYGITRPRFKGMDVVQSRGRRNTQSDGSGLIRRSGLMIDDSVSYISQQGSLAI